MFTLIQILLSFHIRAMQWKRDLHTVHTQFLSWQRLRIQCFAKMVLYKLVKKSRLFKPYPKQDNCVTVLLAGLWNHQQQWSLKKQIFFPHSVNLQLSVSKQTSNKIQSRHLNSIWVPRLTFLTKLTAQGSCGTIYILMTVSNCYQFHLYSITCKRHVMKSLNREH